MAFRESFFIHVVLFVLTAVTYFFAGWWGCLPGAFLLFSLYFFRDPERPISQDPRAIVSGADGLVISVSEEEDKWFQKGKMKRVAVFLSVLDVHVNRSPVEGKITKSLYEPGIFLDARKPEIDIKNEARTWLIDHDRGPVILRQIAGLIARRIVDWSKEGSVCEKGERIGMIRFGSRTDIYLPMECEIAVKKGDKVRGGSSIIAYWPE